MPINIGEYIGVDGPFAFAPGQDGVTDLTTAVSRFRNISITGTLTAAAETISGNLSVSGNVILAVNNKFIQMTTSGGATVNILTLTNDVNNITRFVAGVDAGGFQWTNQLQSVGLMTLTSPAGNLTITGAIVSGARIETIQENPAFGVTVTPTGNDNVFRVTATGAGAFTIANPTNNPTNNGVLVLLIVRNTSGGALGAATFGTLYKQAGYANPANGQSTAAWFLWDGTNYVQVSGWTSAIPN